MNLRQFKLSNSDEIIADVVEIAEEGDLVVRSVLKIFQAEDLESGIRYYSFKPWLSFQNNFEEIIILNIGHVIGEIAPSDELVNHYAGALWQMTNAKRKKHFNIDELERETAGFSDDELREYMTQKLFSRSEEPEKNDSSSTGNVIKFNPKLH